jgi:hypothetical protein
MKILLMAVTATAETGTGPGTITGKIVARADDKIQSDANGNISNGPSGIDTHALC